MSKKPQTTGGLAHGETLVTVTVLEPSGDAIRVESHKTSKAAAIITALDRTFAAYSEDIEVETRTWVGIAGGFFEAFRHAFKLPSAAAVLKRHHREVQLDQREEDLNAVRDTLAAKERELTEKETALEVRDSMLKESRMRLDLRADELDAKAAGQLPIVVTGESVTLLPDGSAEVKVIVGTELRTYREVTVLGPDGQLVTSSHDLPTTLTRIMNFYGVDAQTGMADHVLAAKLLEHVERLSDMHGEITLAGVGDKLTDDPELSILRADGSTVVLDDAEPAVGTAPLGLEAVREVTRKRDRNLT